MVPDLFLGESSSARSHFTFSNPKLQRGNDAGNSSDGSDYMAWAERIKGDRGGYFGRSHGRSVGAWTRRSTATPLMSSPRYVRHGWWKAEQDEDEDDGYGTPSPPLWKNSGNSPTIRSASSSPRHSRRAGPTPRAQEIARYRQEMLELVRGLPESDYELSLRDMVEDRKLLGQEQESKHDGERSTTKGKRSERKESTPTGGLLLGMRFPFSVGDGRKRLSASRGNKKSGLGGIGSSSTSSNSSSGSSSSTTTTTITTTSNSRNKQRMNNCYCFFERNTAGDMD